MRRFFRRLIPLFVVALVVVPILAACASATPTPAPAPPKATAAPKPPPEATKPAAEAPKPAAEAPKPAAEAAKPAEAKPVAAAPKPASGKPIRVGNMEPMTGPMAMFGAETLIAQNLAIEDVNKAGGINGSPLELVNCDDSYDPKQTVTCMRKLIDQEKVPAIFGPFTGSLAEVAFPLANEAKVPVFSHIIVPGMAAQYRPWTFQINLQADEYWPAGVKAFKAKYPDAKNAVIAVDIKERSPQYTGKELLPKLFKDAGINLLGSVDFEGGTTDWASYATKIKSMKPDVLTVVANPPEGFGLHMELEKQGFKSKLLLDPMHVYSFLFWQQSPEYMEGTIFPEWNSWLRSDPKTKDFVERWQAKVKADPSQPPAPPGSKIYHFPSYDISNYDAIMAVAQVMRDAKITPETPLAEARQKIRDGYQNLKNFPGASGSITVKPTGDVSWTAPVMIFEKGEIKQIVP